MSKKGWKYLNEKEFAKIHQMNDIGLTKGQIGKLIGRPYGTISVVLKYSSLKEYREANRAAKQTQRQTTAPKDGTVLVEQTNTNTINTLNIIAKRLDHVETQLQELIDETVAVNAQLGKRKLIW